MIVLLTAVFLTAVALVLVLSLSARRVGAAQREAQRIRTVFARYLPSVIVDDVLASPEVQRFNGRSGYATILVCRISGFALFAEQLGSEETRRYLGDLFTLASKTVAKHGGVVDKFLADGVIAAFGFPLEDAAHEDHALRAALELTRLLDALHARWHAPGRARPRSGIGIHSGTVIAGDVGDSQRRDFRLVGLARMIAARLQEHAEPMRAYILASQTTLEPVASDFVTVAAQTIPLRGMKQNVTAFVVRGVAPKPPLDAPAPAPPAPPRPPPIVQKPRARVVAANPARPKPRTFTARSLDIPELRGFRAIDGGPAHPPALIVEGVYEDGGGPPVRLPP